MSEVHVKGLAELQKFLDQVTPKIEKNVLRGGLRAGANVVREAAFANAPVDSGALKASLSSAKTALSSRARGGRVTAKVRTKVYYAKFVEYGTKPHTISAFGKTMFFGIFARSVDHPGIADPKPFMRPALDSQAGAAVIATAEYMKKRLATKHGLDTADVSIEGVALEVEE